MRVHVLPILATMVLGVLLLSGAKGATMPNGQKYEEWLKSKGNEKDG